MAKSLTKNPVIIEFVGLPGSGKTTLCELVASQLKDRGADVVSRPKILKQWHQNNALQKLVKLAASNFNQWNILVNSVILATRVKPINLQSFLQAGKVFFNVKRNDAIVLQKNCDFILLEQGLLQEVWSVVITGSLPKSDYLKKVMSPLLENRTIAVVNCKLDLDNAVSRIQNRPRKTKKDSYFDLMDAERARALLAQYFPYLQEIINYGRTAQIPILDIDSSLSPEENSEKIIDWIIHQLTNS